MTLRPVLFSSLLSACLVALFPCAVPAQIRVGDCTGEGLVTANELVSGSAIALRQIRLSECPTFDVDRNRRIDAGEIELAVRSVFSPCASTTRALESLVDHDLWESVAVADDPFAAQRPDDALCARDAYFVEEIAGEQSLQISTTRCNFLTVREPLQTDLTCGDRLTIRLFHFQLTAPSGTSAHLYLRVGETNLWGAAIPIPSTSGLVEATFPAPQNFPAGTPAYFHLQNHGANSYNLIEVSTGGSEE